MRTWAYRFLHDADCGCFLQTHSDVHLERNSESLSRRVKRLSFLAFGYFGSEIYRKAPPVPQRVVTTDARSADFLQTPLMDKLRWLRVIGDTIFAVGALGLGWFVLGLKTGWSFGKKCEDVEVAEPLETATR